MKKVLSLLILLLCGCAHREVLSNFASVEALLKPQKCLSTGTNIEVTLKVRNYGFNPLRFAINNQLEPPYYINGFYYSVLLVQNDQNIDQTYEHGTNSHGYISLTTLSMDHGDTAEIIARLNRLYPHDSKSIFRIKLEDQSGHAFLSQPFMACS